MDNEAGVAAAKKVMLIQRF